MSRFSVLIADDNGPVRELLAAALREHFTVHRPVANGKQLVEAALARTPDVVVSDVWMPVLGGLDAMRALKQLGCTTPFVMISADSDIGPDCLAAGAAAFVCKVDVERDLVPAIAAALEQAAVAATRAAPGGAGRQADTREV